MSDDFKKLLEAARPPIRDGKLLRCLERRGKSRLRFLLARRVAAYAHVAWRDDPSDARMVILQVAMSQTDKAWQWYLRWSAAVTMRRA